MEGYFQQWREGSGGGLLPTVEGSGGGLLSAVEGGVWWRAISSSGGRGLVEGYFQQWREGSGWAVEGRSLSIRYLVWALLVLVD